MFDIILVPVISPYDDVRKKIAEFLYPRFRLVYFAAPFEVVSKRDVKGLYQKSFNGEIGPMLGTTQEFPYEIPLKFDIKIDSTPGEDTIDAAVNKILTNYLNSDINLGSRDS